MILVYRWGMGAYLCGVFGYIQDNSEKLPLCPQNAVGCLWKYLLVIGGCCLCRFLHSWVMFDDATPDLAFA